MVQPPASEASSRLDPSPNLPRQAARRPAVAGAPGPAPWVTRAIIGANVAVFVYLLTIGLSPLMPQPAALVKVGANYGPATLGGQWWRLLSSAFLHAGVIHIGFNMMVFWQAGPLLERATSATGASRLRTPVQRWPEAWRASGTTPRY